MTFNDPIVLDTLADVCTQLGFRRTKVYELIAAGLFPPPIKPHGSRTSRWQRSESQAIAAAIAAEASEAELQLLVRVLLRRRKESMPKLVPEGVTA